MIAIFYKCSSLSILPDISKWNISNLIYFDNIFVGCSSLSKIPDISHWRKRFKEGRFYYIFSGCISLSSLPNIFKRGGSFKYFENCFSIINA